MKSPTKCFSLSLLCYLFILIYCPALQKFMTWGMRNLLCSQFPLMDISSILLRPLPVQLSFSINEETGNCIQINVNPGMTLLLARFLLQKLNASSEKLPFFILRQKVSFIYIWFNILHFIVVQFNFVKITAQFCNSRFFLYTSCSLIV